MLAARGFPLNTRCGRRGLCHGCEVRLTEGSVTCGPLTITAPALLRACGARAAGAARGLAATRSRMEHQPQVGETFRIDVPAAHRPLFPPLPDGRDTGFAIDVGTTTVVVLLVDLALVQTALEMCLLLLSECHGEEILSNNLLCHSHSLR